MKEDKIMTHIYYIQGMHCAGCAEKIEKALSVLPKVISAKVDMKTNQLTIQMRDHMGLDQLNKVLKPMTKVTLMEDVLMSMMALGMLIYFR